MAAPQGKSGHLGREECRVLADSLPDTPENVIPAHLLRRGLCDAYARSDLTSFDAAVVRPTSLPEEPFGLGTDAASIWDMLRPSGSGPTSRTACSLRPGSRVQGGSPHRVQGRGLPVRVSHKSLPLLAGGRLGWGSRRKSEIRLTLGVVFSS